MASVGIYLLKIYTSWEEERFHPVLVESAVGLQSGKKKTLRYTPNPSLGILDRYSTSEPCPYPLTGGF